MSLEQRINTLIYKDVSINVIDAINVDIKRKQTTFIRLFFPNCVTVHAERAFYSLR